MFTRKIRHRLEAYLSDAGLEEGSRYFCGKAIKLCLNYFLFEEQRSLYIYKATIATERITEQAVWDDQVGRGFSEERPNN